MIAPTSIYRPDLSLVVSEFTMEARGLVADRIFPILPAKRKAGPINKILGAYIAQKPGVSIKRPSRASAVRGELKSSIELYETERYTMEMDWDEDQEDDFFSAAQIEQMNAMVAEGIIRAELEADVASVLYNTTNFPLSGTTGLEGLTAWTTLASSTPRTNVHAAWRTHRPKGGHLPLEAYGLLMNSGQAQTVADTTDFANRRASGFMKEDGRFNPAEIQAYFGVGEITISNSGLNTAAMGLAASYGEIWSDTYVGLYVIPGRGDSGLQRGAGRIIQWEKQASPGGVAMSTRYETDGGKTIHVAKAESNWDVALLNSQDFFLIKIT